MKRERVANDDNEGDGLALAALAYRNGPGGIKYRVLNVGQVQKPCLVTKMVPRTIQVVELNEDGGITGEDSQLGQDIASRLQNQGTSVNSVNNELTANQHQQSLIMQGDQSKVCLLNPDEAATESSGCKRGVEDDRQRDTDNKVEVDRRYRDKINTSFLQLASILPTPITEGSKQQDSKGATLAKACEYITELKERNRGLNKIIADFINMKQEPRTIPVVKLKEEGGITGEDSQSGRDIASRLQNQGTSVNSVNNEFAGPIYFVVSPDSTLHPANQHQQSLIIQGDQSKVCLLNPDEAATESSGCKRGVRDDRRRATHNEVDRRYRYRDKINTSLLQLASILPTPITEGSKQQDSKGATLSKACEYITKLKERNSLLNKIIADFLNMKQVPRTIPVVELNEEGGITGEGRDIASRLQNQGTSVNSVNNEFAVERRHRDKINNSILQLASILPTPIPEGSKQQDKNHFERRRRDKINNSILQLASILPTPIPEGSKQQDSKGATLSKACEYITELKERNSGLNKIIADFLNMKQRLTELKSQLLEAAEENRDLRERLVEHGIHIPLSD